MLVYMSDTKIIYACHSIAPNACCANSQTKLVLPEALI